MDLFPTLIDICHFSLEKNLEIDGKSLLPLLEGKKHQVHQKLFYHFPHYHATGWTPGTAIRKDDWKLIHFYEDNSYELYNLKSDKEEKNNLIDKNPKKFKELKKLLEETITETNSKIPHPISD